MDKAIFQIFAVMAVLMVVSVVGTAIMIASTKDTVNGETANGNGTDAAPSVV